MPCRLPMIRPRPDPGLHPPAASPRQAGSAAPLAESFAPQAPVNWVLYDAQCRYCLALARWARPVLRRRGFLLAPLQSLWVPSALGLLPRELLKEMRVFTADGRLYGGADAVVFLARRIWWAWPLWALAQIPGAMRPLRAAYRWIAAHRYCGSATCAAVRVAGAGAGDPAGRPSNTEAP